MRRLLSTIVLASLLFSGAGCLGSAQPQAQPVTLTYWRYGDDVSDFDKVVAAYQESHPQVNIKITVIPEEKYREELLTALAEDRGPDMFSIPHTWLRGWMSKIEPMPNQRTIIERQKNQQGQWLTVSVNKPALTLLELQRRFVEVVPTTIVQLTAGDKPGDPMQRRIHALPYSVDTLALYYNRDLLKNAGISEPAQTWNQVAEQAQLLSRKSEDGKLQQSGVAMGASNIRNNTEIICALMMQNGVPMVYGAVPSLLGAPANFAGGEPPGVEATDFYRSFADPNSPNYSWDRGFSSDLDVFTSGRTAYYFGFPGDAMIIRKQAPRLDLGVAPMPQVNMGKKRNPALYPVETVSKKSKNKNYAWDFLDFAAQPTHVTDFLASTKRPTAIRSLIASQKDDPEIGPFVNQVLTAESWYSGYDYPAARKAFDKMVDTEESDTVSTSMILGVAMNALAATYSLPRN